MASIGGSGLDVQGIVSQLMTIERRPLNLINRKISAEEDKISAVGKLSSSISAFQDATKKLQDISKLGQFTAESSNEDILTASVSSLEIEENHSIQVDELATNHRVASVDTYASKDDIVASGSYNFSVAGKDFEITLEDGEASLTDLSNAINRAPDNSGVNASIIKVDEGYRMVLSARESGSANVIQAEGNWEEISAAQDATIQVNGLTIHPSSNTVSEIIPGVTLELKSTGSVDLTTRANNEKIAETLTEFTESYNALQSTLKSLNSGDLKGEGLALTIDTAVRRDLFQSFNNQEGNENTMFSFGFTFDKEGVLSIDQTKLDKAIDDDLYGMLSFFTDKDSFADKLSTTLEGFTKGGGILDTRKSGFNTSIDRFESQAERLESRLDKINERYLKTYSDLDVLVTQMNGTSTSIVQSLGSLNTSN